MYTVMYFYLISTSIYVYIHIYIYIYIYIYITSIYRTNKTNTSKQLLASCLHILQAYNM